MVCTDCRATYVGRHRRPVPLALEMLNEEENSGVFRYSRVDRGWGMSKNMTFRVAEYSTVKMIASDLVSTACEKMGYAKLEMILQFRHNQFAEIYSGSPLGFNSNTLSNRLGELFLQHAIHPRFLPMFVSLNCYTSDVKVEAVQKNELSPKTTCVLQICH